MLEALGELIKRHVGADEQRVAGVHAPPGGQVAEDHLGPLSQPGVDPDLLAVDVDRPRALPARVCGRLAAAPRRRRISRSMTASVPAVRRCEPLGSRIAPTRSASWLISRRAAGLAASSVNREREHRHQPAGPGQRQRLQDEVVVDRVPARVVLRVVQPHVGERHVPDRQIEVTVGQARVGERLAAHAGVRIQRLREPGGRGIQLHPGHLRVRLGARPRNVPIPQPGSSTRPPSNPSSRTVCQITATIAGSV